MPAFYSNNIAAFIADSNNLVIGTLTTKAGIAGFHQQLHTQTLSWEEEIDILKSSFKKLINNHPGASEWGVLLEYPIARRSKRIDVVIIAKSLIIIIEFKVGSSTYTNADKEQLLDYCLDLRDFHFESRQQYIVPILLASAGKNIKNNYSKIDDWVQNTLFANAENLHEILLYAAIY
ncbi:MAG: hypothetical protein EOO47_23935, partial [Flavobacterium sp.]